MVNGEPTLESAMRHSIRSGCTGSMRGTPVRRNRRSSFSCVGPSRSPPRTASYRLATPPERCLHTAATALPKSALTAFGNAIGLPIGRVRPFACRPPLAPTRCRCGSNGWRRGTTAQIAALGALPAAFRADVEGTVVGRARVRRALDRQAHDRILSADASRLDALAQSPTAFIRFVAIHQWNYTLVPIVLQKSWAFSDCHRRRTRITLFPTATWSGTGRGPSRRAR